MFSFSLCSIDQNIPIICKYEAFFLKFYKKFPGHFFKTKINQKQKQTKTVVHSYYSPLLEKNNVDGCYNNKKNTK